MKRYMVDTNVFNRLVDGAISLADLPQDGSFIATHIQRDEISQTKDPARRSNLSSAFTQTVKVVPTESFIIGVSRLGEAKLSDGQDYTCLKAELDKANKGKANNVNDALIAEAAIKASAVLITADKDLANVAEKAGCAVKRIS